MKTTAAESGTSLEALSELDRLREPFFELNRRIVQGVFQALPLRAGGVLEIGAGSGQLRDWLPAELHAQLVHTDACPDFLETLQRKHPAAQVEEANVYELSAADRSQSAVVGLCVFDELDEPERAAAEIARVLEPGGLFVHFLDMGVAALEPLFDSLVRRGRIPLPNFLHDEILLAQLTDAQRATLPQCGLHDDLLSASWQQFGQVLQVLYELGHSISGRLIPYASNFHPVTFRAARAAREFRELLGDANQLARFNKMLLAVYLAVNEESLGGLAPLELAPLSSLDFFNEQLRASFAGEFAEELCDVVAARELAPAGNGQLPPARFHLRSVGRRLSCLEAPTQLSGQAIGKLSSACADPSLEPDDEDCIVESALHVFAARKR